MSHLVLTSTTTGLRVVIPRHAVFYEEYAPFEDQKTQTIARYDGEMYRVDESVDRIITKLGLVQQKWPDENGEKR